MIKLENINFGYEKNEILHNIELNIEKGEFVSVAGENGAGKSTLLRVIRGLLTPSSGSVIIDGRNISNVKKSSLAAKIGFLFQNPDRQLCHDTVREELMFSLKNAVKDKSTQQKMYDEIINEFDIDENANPFEMSRGEKQKIALVSTLITKPDVLLLDEPTTGLNYFECKNLMDSIKRLNKNGCTVVMVCHDMEVVLDYVKRCIVMDSGKIIADGDTKDIFYNDDLISSSAVLPPQIVALSQYMGNPFGRVYTFSEMADMTERTVRQ